MLSLRKSSCKFIIFIIIKQKTILIKMNDDDVLLLFGYFQLSVISFLLLEITKSHLFSTR